MDELDLAPVAVFSGPYTDAMVLQSMLISEGIPASLDTPFLGGLATTVSVSGAGLPKVVVRRSDVAGAQVIVAGFVQHRSSAD